MTKLEVTRNGKCAGAASGTCSQSFFYSWDEVGRLVRARRWDQASVPANFASPAVDLQYHYAAGDSRVLKTARAPNTPEVHTAYIFPGLELRRAQFNVATAGDYTLDSSTEVAYLFANGVRLARLVHQPVTSAGDGVLLRVFFELGDHLGSNSVALDKDTGELVERSTYQVYGGAESSYRPSKWGDFREDYRFTGKEEDVEVGLTYFGKRFYNALLQRWVSPDPLEVHEVGSSEPNVYAYVSGKALQDTDPLGLCPKCNEIASAEAGQFNRAVAPMREAIRGLDKEIQTKAGHAGVAEEQALAAEERNDAGQAKMFLAQRDALLGEIASLTDEREAIKSQLSELEVVHSQRQNYLKQPMMFGDGSSSSGLKLDIDSFVARVEYQANGGALASLPSVSTSPRSSGQRSTAALYRQLVRRSTPEAANRSQFENYKNQLRAEMSRPHTTDKQLSAYLGQLYRPGAKVGSGSTAAAVRSEAATGRAVGDRFHREKAEGYVTALERWLKGNPTASPGDRAAAENVLKDLRNSLEGK